MADTKYDPGMGRSYSVELSESDWDFVLESLRQTENKAKGFVKKTRTHSSLSIASDKTREKHEATIDRVTDIINAITEKAI